MINYKKSNRKEYDWEITMPDNLNIDFNSKIKLYEYDDSLSEIENITRKFQLKQYGQKIQLEEMYVDAIDFYNQLIENSYFENDWYPYRQITIMFEKICDDKSNLENIKRLFHSGIYCNEYQFIWFKHKLKRISKFITINQSEIDTWFDYYNNHGAKNKNKMHKPIIHADCMTTRKNILKTFSLEHFDLKQSKYAFREECRMLEFDKDYQKEFEVLKEYYHKLPRGGMTKKWYNDKLTKINEKLNTNYTIEDLYK